jgi:hypothetical protein
MLKKFKINRTNQAKRMFPKKLPKKMFLMMMIKIKNNNKVATLEMIKLIQY